MLYSVLDVKAKSFGPLMDYRSDEEAIRSFLIAIQNSPKDTLLCQFPVDFTLFRIGDFDKLTGLFTQDVSPIQLITGLEVLQMLHDNNTCSEVAVRKVSDESNFVALKSTEEEVDVVS